MLRQHGGEQCIGGGLDLSQVPLQDVDSAILELEFVMKKLNFSGAEIASHVNGVSIGEARFDFSPHDVFVVPSWEFCQLTAATDCVLFSYSDRAAQEALGFWRERRG